MTETYYQENTISNSYNSYRSITQAGYLGYVHEVGAGGIESALINQDNCTPLEAGGRGAVYRFQSDEVEGIIRLYRRGGFIRHILKDTYFFDNRPLREFEVHHFALQQGLSVPPLLGIAWKQKGPAFQGRIATGYIQSEHLQTWVEKNSKYDSPILQAIGKAILEMHDVGIFHADLQVRNILIATDKVYLIDFDNAAIQTQLKEKSRLRNLLRLKRSFIKNNLPLLAFDNICAGYGVNNFPGWMEWLQRTGNDKSS